jgi:nucleoid DNA-binding protein
MKEKEEIYDEDPVSGSLNRMDIIRRISIYFPTERDARIAVCRTFEIIEEALKDNKKVVISNFGTFIPKELLPRTMQNPKTKETVITKTRLSVRFKPAKNLTKISND